MPNALDSKKKSTFARRLASIPAHSVAQLALTQFAELSLASSGKPFWWEVGESPR
jgi:hypothetical protein